MAGAIIRAAGTSACTTFVTGKAFAFTGIAVTDTAVGALCVLVVCANAIGGIDPSNVIRTDSLGTITRQVRET
jgi:hypothetical protein